MKEQPTLPVRAHIKDWPYVPGYLQATLDPEMIAEHGLAILHRALNNGRLTCFVGSGVSLAYGRLGWGELVRALDAATNDELEKHRAKVGSDANAIASSPMAASVAGWLDQLDLRGLLSQGALDSARYLAAFQFLERIDQLLNASPGGLLNMTATSRLRLEAGRQLFDDGGHAYQLIRRLLEDLGEQGAKKNAEDYSGLSSLPADDPQKWLDRGNGSAESRLAAAAAVHRIAIFKLSKVDLHAESSGAWAARLRYQNALANLAPSVGAGDVMLPPAMRFVVAALARAVEPLRRQVLQSPPWLSDEGAQKPERRERIEFVPPAYDPLLRMARGLGISRFITTNYDLDLERLLCDLGFRGDALPPKKGAADEGTITRTPLGSEARDGIFVAERATTMIDFSLHNADHEMEVVHLHGRVTSPDSMLITDDDYLRQYMQRGAQSDLAESAITLAFASNPMVFVGSSVSEDDILRPLRQFLAERQSRSDRQAVAIMPANGSIARQTSETIALYSRYGVHTHHYGIGAVRRAGSESSREIRWLAEFTKLLGHCRSIFDNYIALCKAVERHRRSGEEDGERHLRDAEATFRRTAEPLSAVFSGEAMRPGQLDKSLWSLDKETGTLPELHLPEVVDASLLVNEGESLPIDDAATLGQLEMATLCAVVQAAHNLARSPALGRLVGTDAAGREIDGDRVRMERAEALVFKELTHGIYGALVGLALVLKLAALETRQRHWIHSRNLLPLARPELGHENVQRPAAASMRGAASYVAGSRQHVDMRVVSRHPLALRASPYSTIPSPPPIPRAEAPESDRFFSDAPSQTFQAFLQSILARSNADPPNDGTARRVGRRVFVLYGDRGVGKGHFFEALRTPRRLGEYIEWTWGPSTHVDYAATAYFNFSFSQEVVSCFDRMNTLLVECAGAVFGDGAGRAAHAELIDAKQQLSKNRVALLRRILAVYAKFSPERRVLFALSPFNMMFDERGNPKNAELFRLIDAALGEASASAPIDWLLLCSGSPLPAMFQRTDPTRRKLRHKLVDGWNARPNRYELELLSRVPISAKGERRVSDTIERIRANVVPASVPRDRKASGGTSLSRPPAAWFHVLREARTANTLAKYFPEVMLCLSLRAGTLSGRLDSNPLVNYAPSAQLSNASAAADLSRRILQRSRDFQRASEMVLKVPGHVLHVAAVQGLLPASAGMGLGDELTGDSRFKMRHARRIAGLLDQVADLLDEDCRLIYEALHKSRFLVTVASAVAAELAWRDGNDRTHLQVEAVLTWWQRLLQSLSSSLANDKPDVIVTRVLDRYHDLHAEGRALPIELTAEGPVQPAEVLARTQGPMGWELQQRILWHLALASHPTEGDVLAMAPSIRQTCGALLSSMDPSPDSVILLVDFVLDLMVRRCLIFRIEPARVGRDDVSDGGMRDIEELRRPTWRFTTHRFMQRTIFRKLRAPHVEHAHVDQFSLSMWATQPDDVPRPNRIAAEQVSALLAAWTGFPKDTQHVMQVSGYHVALDRSGLSDASTPAVGLQKRDQCTLPARMLRASLGVVRTVFSVGVVSHFHDFSQEGETSSQTGGYFEQYRLQIRWLIEQARSLRQKGRGRIDVPDEARAPFFSEEIVWLYNECGVFALVQGRLDSAAGYFHLALRAAESIEPSSAHGALWCRIHLNLAVVDIERGRIREARKNLQIIYMVEDENPILRLLARGYLALVEHYSGNSALAKTWFEEVIEDLDAFGQSRSVAIFSRHLAELYRLGDDSDRAAAVRAADRAIAAATKGGHEDVRQLTRLTRVRLAMEDLLSEERDSIARRLEEIERYAVDMGMPRLLADIMYAKASHLVKLGETRHATHLACKCIEVATTNNLRLRQMTAVALLGRICEARGFHDASRRLLQRAFALAEACDYSNVRASVRRRHG